METDSLVIGRSAQADISIADRSLSRRHARLFRDGDQWLLEDLASRHGTYINGRKVSQSTPVRGGDIIGLSGSLVTVRDSDAPERVIPGPQIPVQLNMFVVTRMELF